MKVKFRHLHHFPQLCRKRQFQADFLSHYLGLLDFFLLEAEPTNMPSRNYKGHFYYS